MTPESVHRGHDELVRRIRSAGERWKRGSAASGALRLAAVVAAGLVLLAALEALVLPPPAARVVLLAALVLGALVCAALWVIRPLVRTFDAVELAARIEEKLPELGERLESSAELWEKRGTGRHGYSVELIDALILRTVSEAAGVEFRIAPDPAVRRRAVRVSIAVLALAVAGAAALGPRLGPALGRLGRPLRAAARPVVTLEVTPGDTSIVSGGDLSVGALVRGPARGEPVLSFVFEGEARSRKAMRPAAVGASTHEVVLANVRSPLKYSVSVGDVSSPEFSVRVVERPFVTGIRLDYAFPRYSGLLPRTVDENNGDITALAGTRVDVTLLASKPLEKAELALASGERLEMSPAGERSFVATLTVRENTSYSIELEDVDGLVNPDPPVYSVLAIRDERPLVRFVEPGEDRDAPRGMVLPLVISAVDDYGISSLVLRYALEGSAEEGVMRLEDAGAGGPRELVREVAWDLSETGLLPGRSLVYYAEVVDNDSVTGPKSSRSESFVVRFPSMSELYSEVTGEHDDIVSELGEMLEEQEEIREQFERIQEDLKSEPEIDWQEEERIEAALDRQEAVADEVVRMADRLSELSDSMSEADRITLETLEKVDEITKLLDEVATEEMRELIEQIREAMERLSPEDVSEATEMLSVSQDDYLKRLEQTLNLLKRAKAEQQLADLANRAQELAEREEQLARDAEAAESEEESQALAEEQERIREAFERLKEDLEQAIGEMSDVDRNAASEMSEAAAQAEACQLSEKLENARQKLAESNPSEAASMCQSASNDLLSLFTRLSQCQGGMSCSLQQRDREATLRAIDELLGVSVEQEEIVENVKNRRRIPRDQLVELVAKEADLVEAMSAIADRMFQVSKDSYVIDPGIFRAFGSVQMMMTRAASHIADGGSAAGHKEARAALGSVNALIVTLLTSNQSSSGSSGGAMQQLMQQLQQMADQQSDLMQMTEQLRRQMEELGMTSEFERQLSEMRARQERLVEQAERLAREFGGRREILGRLDETADEMQRALEEMERSGASQQTIDRQKRILSRLLDAQRSLRRRDYTRERTSRTGERYTRTGPGELPDDAARVTQELREDLLRAMQRGYPSEYRGLIRAYFSNLTRDIENGGEEASP